MMPRMDTTNTHTRLGIPEMDAQHDYLYTLFDRLVDKMTQEEMSELLHEIEGYFDFHITSEEHLIRHYRVPGFAVHQGDHQQAAQTFINHLEAFERGKLNPARLSNAMTGWLAEHSASADMEYAERIKEIRDTELGLSTAT